MLSRRKAREAALQVLYQCDVQKDWSASIINLYFECFQDAYLEQTGNLSLSKISEFSDQDSKPCVQKCWQEKNSIDDHLKFCRKLIFGVIENMSYIDKKLSKCSLHWPIDRMDLVDRNILRIACFEMVFLGDIPINVTINEAIEIGKTFGSQASFHFINGVLDKLAKTLSGFPNLLLDILKVASVNGGGRYGNK